ncbi:hypothetical protein Taro_048731 [Colocasia esculenta]|uniref:Uncharacterized protein n=1 Tax=Colocasia esculenta TaxID=4460 RepID=A0A843X8Y7_COLES|nr:hypothetical protein [Colocasia esculenta]
MPQATSWKLEDAVQLFYVGSEGGGPAPIPAPPSPIHEDSVDKESAPADENVGGQVLGDDDVRPPLPVKREVLYDDASFYRNP